MEISDLASADSSSAHQGGTPVLKIWSKMKGAAGITTAAPHVAGRWGRGNDRLP
jgi:hypothetical protein